MDEADSSSDRRSAGEAVLLPPPEWGKERSPIVGKIIAVAVTAVCVIVVAAIAIWGFDLLGAEEDPRTTQRPNTAQDAAPASSTTSTSRGANEANVGDCVKVVKGGMDEELEVVECGTADARYTVAVELEMQEKCPEGAYLEYSAIGFGGWSLCLALNATVGQCYKNSFTNGFTLTDCAAADYQVVAVLTDRADDNACPPPPPNVVFAPKPLVYPTPPLTICLASTVNA